MCISTGNFDSIFFLGVTPFLNFENWWQWKILLKQLVSTTPLNCVKLCSYEGHNVLMCIFTGNAGWSFWGAIYIPFFVRLPVPNAWNCLSLYTAFSSNVGAWGMWACSLFLSLYPTQRVAEGIMFLTRPSVSQSVSPSVLFFLSVQLLWNRSTEFRETL